MSSGYLEVGVSDGNGLGYVAVGGCFLGSPDLAVLQAQGSWQASGSARRKYRVATR